MAQDVIWAALAAASAPTPAEYRGLGTEPFWSVRITPDRIAFDEANEPGVTISEPAPTVQLGPGGLRYLDTPRLKLWLIPERCSDGMTERIFPDRIILTVDGRRFEGCGGQPLSGPEAP